MRPTIATINLAALRHNLAVVRKFAPRSRIFAVIKANAYGHGVARAVRALDGADGIALLELDAAVRLREAGERRRIALLEGLFDVDEVAVAGAHDLAIVIHNQKQLRMLELAPRGARFDVMLKINTGMNRLGFAPQEALIAREKLQNHPLVKQLTLMTHFATADDARGVAWQMKVFNEIAGEATAGRQCERCIANSAAILRYPETHADWVRPGIMLYGGSPFADVTAEALGLKPVMTLSSEIISVQQLRAGDRVGYAGTFAATQPMRVGTVACGYADGYPRHAPTGTPVLVGGRRTCTLGRVSMDMLCVDLTAIPAAGIGAPVTLWGEGLPADEVAAHAATVSYELMCAVAPRVTVREI
jgi:alanine racemase